MQYASLSLCSNILKRGPQNETQLSSVRAALLLKRSRAWSGSTRRLNATPNHTKVSVGPTVSGRGAMDKPKRMTIP
jgi:hypothetical protein